MSPMLLSLFVYPPSASTFAAEVDLFYWFLIALSAVFSIGIAVVLLGLAVRYRRRAGNEIATAVHGSNTLEFVWSVIPFVISMFIFAWSATIFMHISRPPDDAMEIFVVGKQWMWKIQHMEGRREINTLHVPIGEPVKLTMTSEDVIHSFFIPAFRVKADVVPGRYNTMWFEATEAGEYHLFCAEYCGTEHSRMIGKVVAMEPAAYQAWLSADNLPAEGGGEFLAANAPPSERGLAVFNAQGCQACHTQSPGGIGPMLAGIFGKEQTMTEGETVRIDEAYIRESILNPRAKTVAGYQQVMPTFAGRVSEDDLLALVTYIKSLAAPVDVDAGVGAGADDSDSDGHSDAGSNNTDSSEENL
ncbi:MAG: cytochrome c oxidase subunit 2 [Hyphomicrobiaceae bacterium]|jgi:cytochrome c oxidase subunit 2